MKNEIDENFYCSAGFWDSYKGGFCKNPSNDGINCREDCPNRHRKYPTPEQFKEEYGYEWTGLVYGRRNEKENWSFGYKDSYVANAQVICACTPFPKPDDKWRPE